MLWNVVLYELNHIINWDMNRTTIGFAMMVLLVGAASSYECMQNCQSCSNPYTCDTCSSGKNCCMSTCSTCVNQVQCSACSSSYSLNSATGVCYLTNSCAQSGCVTCAANNTCSGCAAGSYLDQYTYQCSGCVANCDQCSDSSTCTTCSLRYFVN